MDHKRNIYTISGLTSEIKAILDEMYAFIWITGEISNLSKPSSGHFYFTLKDDKAQISAVMFKGQNRSLGFDLESGMKITGMGRVSLYEPRGTYQVILEYVEPSGIGTLQKAFEQLKMKLESEGLFAEKRKRALPYLPERIFVITSQSGAVVHDILRTFDKRFSNLNVKIIPVRVQGIGSDLEVVEGIYTANQYSKSPERDVIIIARGGGSLEDLSAFNSEIVARAIFSSQIPVISAIGHETDFTIADFTADMRAPTPTAAAQMAVPDKMELSKRVNDLFYYLVYNIRNRITGQRNYIDATLKRLVDPKRKVLETRLRLTDYDAKMARYIGQIIERKRERLLWRHDKLVSSGPVREIEEREHRVEQLKQRLGDGMMIRLSEMRNNLKYLEGRLFALSPDRVLERGYSITRKLKDHTILRDTENVVPGDRVEVILASGGLDCTIDGVKGGTENG